MKHYCNIGFEGIRRFFLLILLVIVSGNIYAQENKLQYRPYADLRPFHYGFFFGFQAQSIRMVNNGYIDPNTGDQWFTVNDRYDPGFTVGLVGEWRLSENFAVRLLPTMDFGTRHLTFRNQVTGDKQYQDMKSTYIAMPVHLKFTPPRINNYRPYITAGLSPTYELTIKDQDNIMVKPFNLFFELGFGCDRYLPYFKFIPELKFCFGLCDILQTNRSALRDDSKRIFTKSVKNAKTNKIVLSFYFE